MFSNTLDMINYIYRLFMGWGHAKRLPEKQQNNRAISKNKKPIMHIGTCLLELFLPGLLTVCLREQRAC